MSNGSLNRSHRADKWIKQQAGPESFASFYPASLPPDPPIHYDVELHKLQDSANRALGRLEWIGGTRPGNAFYVPAPSHEVVPAMGALEKFLHDDPVATPPLVKAGLAHAQFETIHPFLDGNGRLGRLLITFVLCAEGVLTQPLLYLSLFFKQHRETYYAALQRIRTEGDWEGWLKFYFTGVEEVSSQASDTAKKLLGMFEEHRALIQKLGKAAGSALRLHELLKKRVILSLPTACTELHLSFPAVSKALSNLEKLGLVREFTGKQRNRLFSYESYLKVLTEGTETSR